MQIMGKIINFRAKLPKISKKDVYSFFTTDINQILHTKLLDNKVVEVNFKNNQSEDLRTEAVELLLKASELISSLGEDEKHISCLVSDCATLLSYSDSNINSEPDDWIEKFASIK